MPLQDTVAYSKIITLPSGHRTIGLFREDHHRIEVRVCLEDNDGFFHCPRKSTNPKLRIEIADKIGVNPETNQPIDKNNLRINQIKK